MDNEDFLTSRQVCRYLGISVTLLNGLEKSGHLLPVRKMPLSNKRLYSAEDVRKFKESVKVGGSKVANDKADGKETG